MTDAERKLWLLLKNERLGRKFRRQQQIGKYIADFACLENKIVIECDGGQHNIEGADKERDKYLKSEGFKILRFWNTDILKNAEAVLAVIVENLDIKIHPHPGPLPSKKGEGEYFSTSPRKERVSKTNSH